MHTVLLVIYLMVVLALIGVVLIQRSEGGGLGIGGGSGFMSARGTANALTRTTAILAALFFVLALGMGILSRYDTQPSDILDRIPQTQQGSGQGVLDALGGGEGTGVPASGENGAATGTETNTNTGTGTQTAPATDTNSSGSDVPSGQ